VATTDPGIRAQIDSIIDQVSTYLGRYGIAEGDASAKGILRVELERDVKRMVQAYWTPFQAEVPGYSIGLHLEVAEPTVHWAEAYLSDEFENWVFVFIERPDGDIQLTQYANHSTPAEAIDKFFKLSGWYVLTATDTKWSDVRYQISPELPWGELQTATAAASTSGAVLESLKKSTIMWLRWRHEGRVHQMPVWYLYDQKVGKIYVLSGERQQTLPGAEQMRECEVILRWKGRNSSVAEMNALVDVITGEDPGWTEIADRIAEKRLNIPGAPEDTAERWRDECVILELSLES
jgi:hypothetical protein